MKFSVLDCVKQEVWSILDGIVMKRPQEYDLNERDSDGNSLLHLLLLKDKVEHISALIKLGLNVNCVNKLKRTVLHVAVHRQCEDVVNMLIENGANVNCVDCNWESPIFFAVRNGNINLVKKLVRLGSKTNFINKSGRGLLHMAICINSENLVAYLLQVDSNLVNKSGDLALKLAVRNYDIVELLLENGVEIPDNILHKAVIGKNLNVLKLLIGSVTIDGHDDERRTPLHLAVEFGFSDAVKILIKAGADVNISDKDGYSPLHTAAKNDFEDLVLLLLQTGAKIDTRTHNGDCVLHLATSISIVPYILASQGGISLINAVNKQKQTPLHIAAEVGNIEVYDFLSLAQGDVEAADCFNRKPRHYFCD